MRGLFAWPRCRRPSRILGPMRQWACTVALLLGLSGNRYAWTARPRIPVPIERPIEAYRGAPGTVLTLAWWRR